MSRAGARIAGIVAAALLPSSLGVAAARAPAAPATPLAPPGHKAAAADVDTLLAQFARAPGLFARFREEKHLAMLNAPLVNEGTIHFTPPHRLARHTERPLPSTLLIDGNQLQFGDADGKQGLDLATNPVARLFVDSFVMLLAGNRTGLERNFKLQFSPRSDGSWQLLLIPRIAPMDKMIKDISLRGEGLTLREMDLRESSGDRTRTTFTEVDVNRRYAPAEQTRIFRLPRR